MSNISLYVISTDLREQLEFLCDEFGEIDEEREKKIEAIKEALVTKTDAVCEWVRSQDDLILAAETRIKQLQQFIKARENGITKLDKYVDMCMSAIDKTTLEGTFGKIVKRAPTDVVMIEDENIIPLDYIKIPQPVATIDKAEIKKALKDGKNVPGAILVKSKTLSISYKVK